MRATVDVTHNLCNQIHTWQLRGSWSSKRSSEEISLISVKKRGNDSDLIRDNSRVLLMVYYHFASISHTVILKKIVLNKYCNHILICMKKSTVKLNPIIRLKAMCNQDLTHWWRFLKAACDVCVFKQLKGDKGSCLAIGKLHPIMSYKWLTAQG